MNTPSSPPLLMFEPPGPGAWELDAVHQPRPWSRFHSELYPAPFARGYADGLARHGLLLATRDIAFVHGLAYIASRAVPDAEMPARLEKLGAVFEQKPWREDLRLWDEEVKPQAIAQNLELLREDPSRLSGSALIDHLARCRGHLERMIYQHMRFTVAAVLPVGDFIHHACAWSGLAAAEVLSLLKGASPISAGLDDEIAVLVDAARASPEARSLLASGDGAHALAALAALPSPVGPTTARYLERVGHRLIDGGEVGDRFALEVPDALLRAIRTAVERAAAPAWDGAARLAEVRARVPEQHREAFDELLGEARHVYRLRDERGVFTDIWASGITRRALLRAGETLVLAGRIERAEHAVDASWAELRDLLSGGGPRGEVLAERALARTRHSAADAPPHLGDEPRWPPVDALPAPARRAMIAMETFIEGLFAESRIPHDRGLLRGVPASPGVFEGTARVIADPSEIDRLQKGDIMVAVSTSEAFNLVLPLLGAIIADRGGALCHAAIVARELGIPAVVGTRTATTSIRDGSRVRVDGARGEVTTM